MPSIIIHGNPIDGLRFIGPFPDGEEIGEEFTERLDEWWIATLNLPVAYVPASNSDPGDLNADETKVLQLIDGVDTLASFAATCGSDDLEERLTDEIVRNDLDIGVGNVDFVKVLTYFQNT